ncbi:hypothetical protein Tco_1150602 [Tanacetum coccineum]
MRTPSLFHPLAPVAPFSGTLYQPKLALFNNHNRMRMMAFKKDGRSGKMVDENMIVLRERIRKMEEIEYDGGDNGLPNNWMEWEKTYVFSGSYHANVYDVIAFLQRLLMETRPSVALGMVAVLAFGGSATTIMVLQWLLNMVQGS